MARKSIYVSDVSGQEIPDGKGAVVTVAFNDARKGAIRMDVTDVEAETIGAKGARVARRGRRPKTVEPASAVV